MKLVLGLMAVLVVSSMAYGAGKPCEELKSEIAGRLDAKGVKNYTLEIVTNDNVGDKKVVGSCEAGTKKITYEKKK